MKILTMTAKPQGNPRKTKMPRRTLRRMMNALLKNKMGNIKVKKIERKTPRTER